MADSPDPPARPPWREGCNRAASNGMMRTNTTGRSRCRRARRDGLRSPAGDAPASLLDRPDGEWPQVQARAVIAVAVVRLGRPEPEPTLVRDLGGAGGGLPRLGLQPAAQHQRRERVR